MKSLFYFSMMRYGFLLFLILLSGTSSAYYEFDNNLHQSYSALMDLQFDKAGELLNKESTEKPGNDLVLLFRNYIDFLKAFISEEEASAEVLKKNSAARLKQLTKGRKRRFAFSSLCSGRDVYTTSFCKGETS
ncbi:MAG: hypothetical protein U0X76_10160 [Bacteroidia bacterium]